jgi:hypothetical protein
LRKSLRTYLRILKPDCRPPGPIGTILATGARRSFWFCLVVEVPCQLPTANSQQPAVLPSCGVPGCGVRTAHSPRTHSRHPHSPTSTSHHHHPPPTTSHQPPVSSLQSRQWPQSQIINNQSRVLSLVESRGWRSSRAFPSGRDNRAHGVFFERVPTNCQRARAPGTTTGTRVRGSWCVFVLCTLYCGQRHIVPLTGRHTHLVLYSK